MILLTDGIGTIVKSYEYDAFGREWDAVATDNNPFRYCGEYYDKRTETVYLRARYYDSAYGRFTQEDPIRDGTNWYIYCDGNPVNRIDPSGQFWITALVVAAIVGAVVTLSGCTQSADYFTFSESPEYNPDVWNVPSVQKYTNCYAYAFNMQVNPITGERFPVGGMQPGMLSGKVSYDSMAFSEQNKRAKLISGTKEGNKYLVNLVKADMKTIGLNFTEYESDMTGGYRVALYVNPGKDYHWYRENKDGTWSHKSGTYPVTNREVLGRDSKKNLIYGDIITDPNTAAEKAGYSVFVGYYYISQ